MRDLPCGTVTFLLNASRAIQATIKVGGRRSAPD
jgi:hypothetical protein